MARIRIMGVTMVIDRLLREDGRECSSFLRRSFQGFMDMEGKRSEQ
jgi:hypothetical protein